MRSTQQFPRDVIEYDVDRLDPERLKPIAHRLRVLLGEDGVGGASGSRILHMGIVGRAG